MVQISLRFAAIIFRIYLEGRTSVTHGANTPFAFPLQPTDALGLECQKQHWLPDEAASSQALFHEEVQYEDEHDPSVAFFIPFRIFDA